jgi:dTDP-4-dehydrorhamnose reductase
MMPQVETLRVLNNLSEEKYNKELGSIQYTDKKKSKSLIVVANKNGKPGSIDIKFARILKTLLDETDFNHVYVFGETQTASAYNILRKTNKATISTLKMRIRLSTDEILEAFRIIANSLSKKENDNNEVENLLDNAIFHARMGWKDQLLQEFTHLLELQQEIIS